ncbi:MAG: PAS domain-containing sensor histidine kinase, partial [Patescibacteria group bacterium]|nr:PAS domain-containing sensor histidine kinase [Patescibacteria group bacterium]
NAMAANLREFYRSNRAQLIRIQRATQQTFNSLPDPIAIIDLKGNIELSTEKASEIFDLKPNVLIKDLPYQWLTKMHIETLMTHSPVEPEGKDAFIQTFVQGEERYFQPKAVPILDQDRKTLGIALILKDVTELIQQKEMKKGVIALVSHQLNTPLTSIRMAIHLLLEGKVGPLTLKQTELLVAARDDSDRLYSIIANLLDMSRIESGKVALDFRSVSSKLLIQDAVNPFLIAAQDQGITLSIEARDDLPEVLVDTTRINHVFNNLLSNSLKYTPAGGKIILKAEESDTMVKFSVSDTGKGIPNEYIQKIFEQFFRVPGQSTGTGAGLGLAIAKDIVEAHGGEITVESKEGAGSTFTFTLKKADRISQNGKPDYNFTKMLPETGRIQ